MVRLRNFLSWLTIWRRYTMCLMHVCSLSNGGGLHFYVRGRKYALNTWCIFSIIWSEIVFFPNSGQNGCGSGFDRKLHIYPPLLINVAVFCPHVCYIQFFFSLNIINIFSQYQGHRSKFIQLIFSIFSCFLSTKQKSFLYL